MVQEYAHEKKQVRLFWPEILRLMIQSQLFDFEAEDALLVTSDKLETMCPKSFHILSVQEKVQCLLFLINSIRDTQVFRDFINEDILQSKKAELSKAKNDLYAEIKELDQEKKNKIKENA